MILLTRRDLQYRAARFVVVTIGVGVVMTLLFLMTGLIEQFNEEPFATIDTLGAETWVVPAGTSGPITASAALSADSVAAVDGPGATPVLIARGALNAAGAESSEVLVVGHVPRGLGAPVVAEGRAAERSGEVAVDVTAGFGVGDTVLLGSTQLTVVGVTEDTTVLAGLPGVFVGIDDARVSLFDGRPIVSAVLLSGPAASVPEAAVALPADSVAADALGPLENAISSIDLIRGLLWAVAAIIIGAVVYLSSLERGRDFAVLKAIGASNRDLVASVALQAVIIAVAAALLAAALQAAIQPVFPLKVRVPARALWQIPVIAVAIAVLAGIGGMRRVARSDPAEAFGGPGA